MTTRDIRTSIPHTACDVCGRTLLRGERAETYLAGGDRRSVCQLCLSRALNEGWVREGTVPAFDRSAGSGDRRRSLFGRLRSRSQRTSRRQDDLADAEPLVFEDPAPAPAPTPAPRPRELTREPRHVRAVPTSAEQKVAAAIELFNTSDHRRTVAGVARSLGRPDVSVLPSSVGPSIVNVVTAWELCWYRYEVDLSDDLPGVRVAAQGYELSELPDEERHANATADEQGVLSYRS